MIRYAIPAVLILAGCTATAATSQREGEHSEARLQRTLAGLEAGKPRQCLHDDQFNEIRTFDRTILYVAGRNRVYRNDVVGHCEGLKRGDTVVTINPGGDFCSGNIVQTRARLGGMITGSCSLGEFVPYTK